MRVGGNRLTCDDARGTSSRCLSRCIRERVALEQRQENIVEYMRGGRVLDLACIRQDTVNQGYAAVAMTLNFVDYPAHRLPGVGLLNFDQHDRAAASYQFGSPVDHLRLMAFNVDLDEPNVAKV